MPPSRNSQYVGDLQPPRAPTTFWEHHMRLAAFIAALFVLIQPARAAVVPEIDPGTSLGVVQQWIYNYRASPEFR